MKIDEANKLLESLRADVLDFVAGADNERLLLDQAAQVVRNVGGRGGSTRAYAERTLIDLVTYFDDTFGENAWPVSRYLAGKERRADQLKHALEDCVAAHKSGQYDQVLAAMQRAQDVLASTPTREEGNGE